jgi:hypothetical protein
MVVQWQGERYDWGAYIPGDYKRPTSARTPVEAIAMYLDHPADRAPEWIKDLSEGLEVELAQAPRYACDCCGYRTLLNPGRYEICDVCGWEDDRADRGRRSGGPDAPSGPNRISLSEGRANFARFGASKERSKPYVREPRPDEYP